MNFDINLEMIPRQMSCIQLSSPSEIVRMKSKCIVLISDDDHNDDFVEISGLPGQSSASPTDCKAQIENRLLDNSCCAGRKWLPGDCKCICGPAAN